MLIGTIISFIKTGKLLGRFLISESTPSERKRLQLRLRGWKSEKKSLLVKQLLDSEELERRRELYAACDAEKAWETVCKRLDARQGGGARPSPPPRTVDS